MEIANVKLLILQTSEIAPFIPKGEAFTEGKIAFENNIKKT